MGKGKRRKIIFNKKLCPKCKQYFPYGNYSGRSKRYFSNLCINCAIWTYAKQIGGIEK